jgi:ABC-2 type transport system permease protein
MTAPSTTPATAARPAPEPGPAPVALAHGRTSAPLARMLRSELRWLFRRPRTLIALGLLALVPILIGVGVKLSGDGFSGGPPGSGGGAGPLTDLVANGLVLPIAALTLTLTLLLPLISAMWAADALAGEAAAGTLRGLLLAPVGRLRLLGIKAFGIAVATLAAALVIAVVGVIAGLILVGSHGMVTVDGTTLSFGAALVRILLAVLWVTFQVWAVAAIALAVSACTEHPIVVMAATLTGAIVCGVLGNIPALSWIQPYLLTTDWGAVGDFVRDPVPTGDLLHGLAMAACYLVVGLSLAVARTATKDG